MQLWVPEQGRSVATYRAAANGAVKQFGARRLRAPRERVRHDRRARSRLRSRARQHRRRDHPADRELDPPDRVRRSHRRRNTGVQPGAATVRTAVREIDPTPDCLGRRHALHRGADDGRAVRRERCGRRQLRLRRSRARGDYLVEAIPPCDTRCSATGNADRCTSSPTRPRSTSSPATRYVPQGPWTYDTPAPRRATQATPAATERATARRTRRRRHAPARLHLIDTIDRRRNNPDFNANGGSPGRGRTRPYCNVKLVQVQPRRSIAPIFHIYTDVPIPTRFVGYIIDDLNVSTDPKSTVFGEKAGMPNVPVGVYDYTGRLVYTAESDYNGYYEVLLPSTDTIACPTPSGVCPNVYRLIGNDPGQQGTPNNGRRSSGYNPQYRTISTKFQGWPGVVHPVDQAPTRVAASLPAARQPGASYPPACARAGSDSPSSTRSTSRTGQRRHQANRATFTISGKCVRRSARRGAPDARQHRLDTCRSPRHVVDRHDDHVQAAARPTLQSGAYNLQVVSRQRPGGHQRCHVPRHRRQRLQPARLRGQGLPVRHVEDSRQRADGSTRTMTRSMAAGRARSSGPSRPPTPVR